MNWIATCIMVSVLSLAGGSWLGYEYESRALDAFKATQLALAQRAADEAAATAKHDKEVRDEIDAKDQRELADYGRYVAQLLRNHTGSGTLPAPTPGPQLPGPGALGPGPAEPDRPISCPDSGQDASDHVTLDALIQLQRWREYARETGQGQ